MLIRRQQLWRIKDCKAIAGEHITTQHKPVVFVVRMNRTNPNKIVGRKTIKWWKCIDAVAIEYRERVKVKYEELVEEVNDVEEEWKKYKDAYFGNAEELCGRSNSMGGKARKKSSGGQLKSHQQYVKRRKPGRLLGRSRSTEISLTEGCCIYMDRRKTTKRAVVKARNDMEADL